MVDLDLARSAAPEETGQGPAQGPPGRRPGGHRTPAPAPATAGRIARPGRRLRLHCAARRPARRRPRVRVRELGRLRAAVAPRTPSAAPALPTQLYQELSRRRQEPPRPALRRDDRPAEAREITRAFHRDDDGPWNERLLLCGHGWGDRAGRYHQAFGHWRQRERPLGPDDERGGDDERWVDAAHRRGGPPSTTSGRPSTCCARPESDAGVADRLPRTSRLREPAGGHGTGDRTRSTAAYVTHSAYPCSTRNSKYSTIVGRSVSRRPDS